MTTLMDFYGKMEDINSTAHEMEAQTKDLERQLMEKDEILKQAMTTITHLQYQIGILGGNLTLERNRNQYLENNVERLQARAEHLEKLIISSNAPGYSEDTGVADMILLLHQRLARMEGENAVLQEQLELFKAEGGRHGQKRMFKEEGLVEADGDINMDVESKSNKRVKIEHADTT